MNSNSKEKMIAKEATIDFVSGCVGGVACVVTGQPLDTVKIKMQTFSSVYKNSVKCFVDILRSEGIRGLYAGTSPALVSNIMENSVIFLAYGQCQNFLAYLLQTERSKLSPLNLACAGSLTSIFSSIVLCPAELVKCRLQTAREIALLHGSTKEMSMLNTTKLVLRQDGILGFYRGLSALFLREFSGNFFFFGGYEFTKFLLLKPGEDPAAWKLIIAGGMGGVSFWGPLYPADVLKSKLQIYQGAGYKPSILQLAQTMLKEEGIGSFYRGIGPTLIRAFPANAALFLTYESTKSLLWEATE